MPVWFSSETKLGIQLNTRNHISYYPIELSIFFYFRYLLSYIEPSLLALQFLVSPKITKAKWVESWIEVKAVGPLAG